MSDAQLPDAADLIRPYISDVDEYVRRRSLLAFAPFSPTEAEAIAKNWMDEEYEYSRIAGLHVLDIINSGSIEFYLQRHRAIQASMSGPMSTRFICEDWEHNHAMHSDMDSAALHPRQ